MKFWIFLWKILATLIAYTDDNKELALIVSILIIILETFHN
jgi:hypothetical protein